LTSSGFKPGFLTVGVMNDFLNGDGKRLQEVDRLNRVATYGDIRSDTAFKTDVGIGSAADELSGSRLIIVATSSVVAGSKHRNVEDDRLSMKHGGGDPAVD
jgi:hypothetical protein